MKIKRSSVAALVVAGGLLVARPAAAHCDTAEGPVIVAAKIALEMDMKPRIAPSVAAAARRQLREHEPPHVDLT